MTISASSPALKGANLLSRRSFAGGAAIAATQALLTGWASAQNGSMHTDSNPPAPPADPSDRSGERISRLCNETSRKFHADGTPRPFAGNTIICRTPPQGLISEKLGALHEALRSAPFSGKLALVPTESYHMTVLSGANDQDREHSCWPSGVPLTASIEACSRAVAERLTSFRLQAELPFRLRLLRENPRAETATCSLGMAGADGLAEQTLRDVRRQLAAVYGCRLPLPDVYRFHITIAYCLAEFSTEEFAEYRSILSTHRDSIAAALPVIEFGLPEFCTFPDMRQYDFQHYLRASCR